MVSQAQKSAPQVVVQDTTKILESVDKKLSTYQLECDSHLKNLETALSGINEDVRQDMNHKFEDVLIKAKTSSSRYNDMVSIFSSTAGYID